MRAVEPGLVVASRYRLIARAGSGGMGEVWSARDEHTGARIALKVMLERNASLERFTREAEVLSSLAHPAIVAYVDHGIADGVAYLAMEWLEGEDLAQRLARGPLSIDEVSALAERLASALAAAHRAGVIHRDLKPSNVFLCAGDAGAAKLVDFGIARREDFTRATGTGLVIGTPGYMAPEQVRGERDLDARADVFALGCVLFEAASGRPAFAGDAPLAILAKVLLEDAPPLAALVPDLPARLGVTIARMLAKERHERPSDGAAVLHDLSHGAATAPARAPERAILTIVGVLPTDLALAPTLHGAAPNVETSGARLERLADGTLLYVFSGGAASVHAARKALAIRSERPDAPIAIATGRAVIGAVVGEVVDRVTALLAIEGRAIRLDPLTAGLLDVRFDIGGDAHGLTLGVERSTTEPRLLLGRPAPCVGRDRDLSILRATWEECALDRAARAVVVTAPAGAGKTRLAAELVRALEPVPATITATGDPLLTSVAYGVLAQAIRRAASIADRDPLELARQKLAARLSRHPIDEAAREVLGEVAGVPSTSASPRMRALANDPVGLADAIRGAVTEWLRAEASEPFLVVIDDVHWADEASLRVLDAAIRKLASRPIMIVALGRPETRADLFARAGAVAMRLAPLGRRACAELVQHALGGASESVASRIAEQSEGNAFFLEELIRAAASGGEMPDTVIALGHARLSLLDAAARRVVRAASVFGLVFHEDGLRALSAESSIESIVSDLVEREIFERRDGALAFRHALLREAAYGMSTEEEQRSWHASAAEWLAQRSAPSAIVADHFERAGERAKAAHWYRRAAVDAYRFDDVSALTAAAEKGIACGAEGVDRGYLLSLMASARWWAGDPQACLRYGREALASAERGTSAWFQALAAAFPAIVQIGSESEARELAKQLAAERPTEKTARRYTRAAAFVATELSHLGEIELASTLVDRVVAGIVCSIALRGEDPALESAARTLAGDRSAELERIADELFGTREALLAAIASTEGGQRPWVGGLAVSERLAAWRALFTGHPWRALRLGRTSQQRFETLAMVRDPDWSRLVASIAAIQVEADGDMEALIGEGTPPLSGLFTPAAFYVRAQRELERGDLDVAAGLFQKSVEGVRRIGSVPMIGIVLAGCARVSFARGDIDRATACFDEALPGVERFLLHAKTVWTVGARIAVARGDLHAARHRIDRARGSIAAGAHEGEVMLRLDEHDVRRAIGDRDGASSALAAARAELERVARSIDSPAHREAFLHGRRARRLAEAEGG